MNKEIMVMVKNYLELSKIKYKTTSEKVAVNELRDILDDILTKKELEEYITIIKGEKK